MDVHDLIAQINQHRIVPQRLPPRNFGFSLKAAPAFINENINLEQGNKILLPQEVLHNLSQYRLPNPLIFSIQNTVFGNSTNAGVLEFTAPSGTCCLPNWLFEVMNLELETEVNVMLQTAVPKGKFIKIQPHETAFIDLPDPRSVLEKQLGQHTCITKGETVCIHVGQRKFMEVEPANNSGCICVIESDIKVEFAPPLDYKEPEPTHLKGQSSLNLNDEEEDESDAPFQGKGIKLNGQLVKQQDSQAKKKKVSDDTYDPRKYRLPNGVRQTIIKDDFNSLKVGLKIGMSSIHKPTTAVYDNSGEPSHGFGSNVVKRNTNSIAGSTGISSNLMREERSSKIEGFLSRNQIQARKSENTMELESLGDVRGQQIQIGNSQDSQSSDNIRTIDKASTQKSMLNLNTSSCYNDSFEEEINSSNFFRLPIKNKNSGSLRNDSHGFSSLEQDKMEEQ